MRFCRCLIAKKTRKRSHNMRLRARKMVPLTGLEPVLHKERDFKSRVSTYSTTAAHITSGRNA